MKEYNKEKLHEYAKELFALCLEKGVSISVTTQYVHIFIYANEMYTSYLTDDLFSFSYNDSTQPIWELIEKVKQL